MVPRIIWLVVALFFLYSTAQACIQPEEAARKLEIYIRNSPGLKRSTPGVLVEQFNQTSKQWRHVYGLLAEDFHTPASNNKVLTCAAALTKLHPDYRIRTPVHISNTGENVKSMCISGRGDPSMGGGSLDTFVNHVKNSGIKNINVITYDDSWFKPDFPDGWEWGDLPFYYAAPPSSFIIDENVMNVRVSPGSAAGQTLNYTFPTLVDAENLKIDTSGSVTLAPGGASFVDVAWHLNDPAYLVVGNLPIGHAAVTVPMAIKNPSERFQNWVNFKLKHAGVTVSSSIIKPCKEPILFYEFVSDSLNNMMNRTLQVSDNLMTEVWMRTLGALDPGVGSAPVKGKRVVKALLESIGVPTGSFDQKDGSGLDASNLVSPVSLVQTLKGMGERQWAAQFKSYLPNSRPGGGLYSRFVGTPAANRVFAKTGYIGLVSSLSGWVDDDKLFSILLDHSNTPSEQRNLIIKDLVLIIADLCPMK